MSIPNKKQSHETFLSNYLGSFECLNGSSSRWPDFIYQENKPIIDRLILSALHVEYALILPNFFRQLRVRITENHQPLDFECSFEDNSWRVYEV